MKRHALLMLLIGTLCSPLSWSADSGTESRKESAKARNTQKLEETVLNQNLTLEKRVKALKQLLGDQMTDGKLKRTFCIWDPLGKGGPIASATNDQILRSLHYGLDLHIEVFQSEDTLVNSFTSDDKCDAMLVRGSTAIQFNRFLGTVEAPGALPGRDHLYLLAQVLAKPDLAARFTEDGYTALGLVTLGGSHLYARSADLATTAAIRSAAVAIPYSDRGNARFAEELGGHPQSAGLLPTVQAFTTGANTLMVAPDIGFLIMAGSANPETRAMATPVAQSTLQLIGKADRFPTGLAQILREDFLFRFNNYARLLDKELANFPQGFWVTTPPEVIAQIESTALDVRLALRDNGYYDPFMLRLARKIRCRFDATRSECNTSKE